MVGVLLEIPFLRWRPPKGNLGVSNENKMSSIKIWGLQKNKGVSNENVGVSNENKWVSNEHMGVSNVTSMAVSNESGSLIVLQ